MTPLAHSIAKEFTIPAKRRSFADSNRLLPHFSDIHCFEISDVWEVMSELGGKLHASMVAPDGTYKQNADLDERTSFLPAERTWIEWIADDKSERIGFLLEEQHDKESGGKIALGIVAVRLRNFFGSIYEFALPLSGFCDFGTIRTSNVEFPSRAQQITWMFQMYGALAIINTPRIVGRRQHMPHRSLERELTKRMGVGKFPLHAWTEIKLHITPPKDMSGDPSTEAHLTGQRALHFCRAHLRVRLGRLEIVRSHWRGDPALGIKQSRYAIKS
jgi:hypothetical protein